MQGICYKNQLFQRNNLFYEIRLSIVLYSFFISISKIFSRLEDAQIFTIFRLKRCLSDAYDFRIGCLFIDNLRYGCLNFLTHEAHMKFLYIALKKCLIFENVKLKCLFFDNFKLKCLILGQFEALMLKNFFQARKMLMKALMLKIFFFRA